MSDGEAKVEVFFYSDYVGCIDTKIYLHRYVFIIFATLISWKASLQKLVALSTSKVKYIALSEVVNEALRLEGFIKELKLKGQVIVVKCDIYICQRIQPIMR